MKVVLVITLLLLLPLLSLSQKVDSVTHGHKSVFQPDTASHFSVPAYKATNPNGLLIQYGDVILDTVVKNDMGGHKRRKIVHKLFHHAKPKL